MDLTHNPTAKHPLEVLALDACAATFLPDTYDAKTNEIDVVWFTQTDLMRMDVWGNRYIERFYPEGANLTRLNEGCSFFWNHAWKEKGITGVGQRDIIGNVVPGSASLTPQADGSWLGKARVRLIPFPDVITNETPDDQAAAFKVAHGYIRGISQGYSKDQIRVEEFPNTDQPPILHVEKFSPFELSAAPIQAAIGAGTQSMEAPMTIRFAPDGAAGAGGAPTPQPTPAAQPGTAAGTPGGAPAPAAAPAAPAAVPIAQPGAASIETPEQMATRIRIEERERAQGIRAAVTTLGLSAEMVGEMEGSAMSLQEINSELLRRKARLDSASSNQISGAARITRDQHDTLREAIVEGICARSLGVAPSEKGKQFMALNLVGVARHYLRQIGVSSAEFMSELDVINAALGFSSAPGQTMPSDLPILLQQVGNRSLVKGYAAEPRDFEKLVRFEQVSDFRKRKAVQFAAQGGLKRILPGKAPDVGTFTESAEEYGTAPWGRGWFVDRTSLINDDTGAFGRLPFEAGKKIRQAELIEFWTKFVAAKLSDNQLVCSAAHKNVTASGGSAPSVDEVAKGVVLMAAREDLSGDRLNIQPDLLIGPSTLWGAIMKLTGRIAPTQTSDVVPAIIGTLSPIVQGRLDAYSTKKWWLGSSAYPCFAFTTLNGQSEPRYRSQVDFETEGVKAIINYDFDIDALDSLGLYQNKGEN